MVLSTYTTFKFKFTGSKEQFFQNITNWVEESNTEKGRKYQIKDSHFTLQRGSIIIKFSLTKHSPSLLDVMVIGFTKGDHPLYFAVFHVLVGLENILALSQIKLSLLLTRPC